MDLDGDGRIDAKDRDYRISTINDIVRRYNIRHCVVQFVDKTVKEYAGPKPGCRVGISPCSGTLGAFVNGGNKEDARNQALYALISNHVAERQPDTGIPVTFIGETTAVQTRLGAVTVSKGALDIAAIKVDANFKGSCDTRLLTPAGKPTMCKTFRYNEKRQLFGLIDKQVYIHGATTSGVHGKITQPEYTIPSMPSTYVVVEDDTEIEASRRRFAEPGDSGAVACAEVPGKPYVEAISVIQGELVLRDTSTKSEESEATAHVTPTIVEGNGPSTKSEVNECKAYALPMIAEDIGPLGRAIAATQPGQASDQQERLITETAVKDDSGSEEKSTMNPRRYLTIPLQAGLEQIREEHGLKYLQICNEVTNETQH